MPRAGITSQDMPTPWQSIGAEGVSGLASKLLLALFPPSQSFFRLRANPFQVKRLLAERGELGRIDQVLTETERALIQVENAVHQEIETQGYRTGLFEVFKQLLCSGNQLVHLDHKSGKLRSYRLDSYVAKRDQSGNLLLVVLHEKIARVLLERRGRLAGFPPDQVLGKLGFPPECEDADLYTVIERQDDDTYEVWEEAGNSLQLTTDSLELPGTRATWKADRLPWLALRIEEVTGTAYGYGYATTLLGDLKSAEGLSKAIVQGAAAAAKLLVMVAPASPTSAEDIRRAPNGAVVVGREGDVTMLTVGSKAADMRIALETLSRIEDRLERAFLRATSVQRQAERVTAEEIRLLAQDLEGTLAGSYSLLSAELQLPFVRLVLDRMEANGGLPAELDRDLVRPSIVTGLEALGRGQDLTKLDVFLQGALATLGAETVAEYVNIRNLLQQRANALGLDTEELLRSEEEVQQGRQQRSLMELASRLGPESIRQYGQAQQAANGAAA